MCEINKHCHVVNKLIVMASKVPNLRLNNGLLFPVFGLGTWQVRNMHLQNCDTVSSDNNATVFFVRFQAVQSYFIIYDSDVFIMYICIYQLSSPMKQRLQQQVLVSTCLQKCCRMMCLCMFSCVQPLLGLGFFKFFDSAINVDLLKF